MLLSNPQDDYGVDPSTQTSLEAAALILSQGQTKDPAKAHHIAQGGNPFDMDALQRAHLRRMMGFDFSLNERYKKVIIMSNQSPLVSEEFDFSGVWDEESVELLVEHCLKLKEKYEAELEDDTAND